MTDAEKVPDRPEATWNIELNATCGKCGEYVNLLDAADFWDGRKLAIGEAREAVDVYCPGCGHEFEVDCVY